MKVHASFLAACAVQAALGLLVVTGVTAAPATSEEINPAADQPQASQPPGQSTVPNPTALTGSGVRQSTTVELLLQLQDRPNPLGNEPSKFGPESTRRANGPSTKTVNSADSDEGNSLAKLKESMLGSATPRSAEGEAREQAIADNQSSTGSDRRALAGGTPGATEPRESLLLNPVVRFIRENRALIVSVSVVVLVGIWLTANFSIRRGR